jgi:hypothetical protein
MIHWTRTDALFFKNYELRAGLAALHEYISCSRMEDEKRVAILEKADQFRFEDIPT